MKPAPMLIVFLSSVTISTSACVVDDDELGQDTQALEEEDDSPCPLPGPEARILSFGSIEWIIMEPPGEGDAFAVEQSPGVSMVFDPERGTCVNAEAEPSTEEPPTEEAPTDGDSTEKPKPNTCSWEDSSACGWKTEVVEGTAIKTCGPTKKQIHTEEAKECGHKHPPAKTTTCAPSGAKCLQQTKTTSICS